MMSNWCLTANDSAATAPRPPGLARRAKVTSKWAIKLNSNLIETNLNGVGTFHKSALQRRILPESVFRHTQGDGVAHWRLLVIKRVRSISY
jgi:hypothetical protein